MSAQIYFSSGSFVASNLGEVLDQCQSEALPGLELSSGLPYAAGMLEEAQAAKTRPFPLLVHNYFPPPAIPFVLNLASSEEATLAASMELCRQNLALTAELGAPFYSVHSGFAMNLSPAQLGQPETQATLEGSRRIDRPVAERTFGRNVAELAGFAREKGVGLLLENNVLTKTQVTAGRGESLLMTSPTEVQNFLQEHPGVGFLLDVAHARVAAGALGFAPEEFFTRCGGQIGALHLSDNDGERDNNRPFDEKAWFAPYLKDFTHLPMVIEVYHLDAEARARQLDLLLSLLP